MAAAAASNDAGQFAASSAAAAGLVLFLAGKTCMQFLLSLRRERAARSRQVGSVSQLFLYPIKSCLGVQVTRAQVTEFGLSCQGILDRSFAVVSAPSGKYVGLKQCPQLSRVQPILDATSPAGIRLSCPSEPLRPEQPVSIGMRSQDVVSFEIFGQATHGRACNAQAIAWLREVCSRNDLLLVYCSEPSRPTLEELRECQRLGIASAMFTELPASGDSRIAYASTAPLLLTTEVALEAVNRRLADKGKSNVDWRNFRPNLVISGPIVDREEETWSYVFADRSAIAVLSPCTRCSIVTVDYTPVAPRATLRPDGEPLKTLAEYRKDGAFRKYSPVFGVNGFVERAGDVWVGCEVFAS